MDHIELFNPNIGKSPKAHAEVPGPGQYTFKNKAVGEDALTCTLKSRVRCMQGKISAVNQCCRAC